MLCFRFYTDIPTSMSHDTPNPSTKGLLGMFAPSTIQQSLVPDCLAILDEYRQGTVNLAHASI